MKLKVLDLFSGIGGFSLGLERTGGFETVAFCEINPFCRQVLAKHWPGVPIHDDIQVLSADWLAETGAWPDVICGGFPCTDISVAGKGAGITGPQSGLWREYARLIGEIRPRFVLVENVAALLGRGLADVLGDLAALGYDAEWHCIPAAAIGAPHRRDRVWIVADATRGGWGVNGNVSETRCDTRAGQPSDCGADVANACITRLQSTEQAGWRKPIVTSPDVWRAAAQCGWRRAEPGMGGTLDGVSAGAHRYPVEVEPWEGDTPRTVGRGYADRPSRLRAIGNAVVPQISELIGRAILEAHR
jgi:DNA (cytosine-5)-methyltransferase 1